MKVGSVYSVTFGIAGVLVFSLTLSLVVEGIAFDRRTVENLPNWQPGSWVSAVGGRSTGFFRKRFKISGEPLKGYLIASAGDKLTVYFNGTSVASGSFFAAKASVGTDLSGLLRAGMNTVAISVESGQTGTEPVVAVRIRIVTSAGQLVSVDSDDTWRAIGREERPRPWSLGAAAPQQAESSRDTPAEERSRRTDAVPWYGLDYPDHDWPLARPLAETDPRAVRPLPVPESVLAGFPRGDWVWDSAPVPGAVVASAFEVPAGTILGGWLGISFGGTYSLALNGVAFEPQRGSPRQMNLTEVSALLKSGVNRVVVSADTADSERRLLISGWVWGDFGLIDFSSGDRWWVLDRSAGSRSHPVQPISFPALPDRDRLIVSLSPTAKEPTLPYLWLWLGRIGTTGLILTAVASVGFAALLPFGRKQGRRGLLRLLRIYALPFYLGAIINATVLLARLDLRFETALANYPQLPLFSIVIVFGLSAILVVLAVRHGAAGRNAR